MSNLETILVILTELKTVFLWLDIAPFLFAYDEK